MLPPREKTSGTYSGPPCSSASSFWYVGKTSSVCSSSSIISLPFLSLLSINNIIITIIFKMLNRRKNFPNIEYEQEEFEENQLQGESYGNEGEEEEDQGVYHRPRGENNSHPFKYILILTVILFVVYFSKDSDIEKQELSQIKTESHDESFQFTQTSDMLNEEFHQKESDPKQQLQVERPKQQRQVERPKQQLQVERQSFEQINKLEEIKQQKVESGKGSLRIKPDPVTKKGSQIPKQKVDLATQLLDYQDYPEVFDQEKQRYESQYKINQFQEKPFCVVIPTFENTEDERFQRNIDSLLTQDYSNYRVLIIDDASPDQTGEVIRGYLSGNPVYQNMLDNKVFIQINEERKMALPNQLEAARNFCKPEQLLMILDGDDFLLGRQVLKLFNAVFSSKDVWIAYSNFLTVSHRPGFSREYPEEIKEKGLFRRVYFGISHLRVFYSKLLTLVKDEDLRDKKKNYYRAANDVAIYMPMMQMAGKRIEYIKEINYFYNSKTEHNNHKEKKTEQRSNEAEVRKKPTYKALDQLF